MAVPKCAGGFGFRDFQLFNDAMLGKQAWRLIENSESLCARTLKGRYFPNNDILSAGCPKSASRTWRAIICGRDVLNQGLIRRVGNGQTTSIWNDRWIPGMPSFIPMGKMSVEDPTDPVLVSDLLEEHSGNWDEAKIRKHFYARDATAILCIPRPRGNCDDIWSWSEEKSGIYSVRSAYRLLVRLSSSLVNEENCSNSENGGLWKKLWKLAVVPKIRVFWWRVVKDLLPCYSELTRRHVMVPTACKLCSHAEESLFHALINCEHAKLFWTALEEQKGLKLPKLHPRSWASDLTIDASLSNNDKAIFVTLCWCIWSSRNKFVHGEEQFQPSRSLLLVDELVSCMELPPQSPKVIQKMIAWEPPLDGWASVCTDGSLDVVQRVAGSGYVIRTCNGVLIEGGCNKHLSVEDPFISELLACRDGLEAARRLQLPKVILQTDCSALVSLWHDVRKVRTEGVHILNELKIISQSFQAFKILYLNRSANNAAHVCAREALSIDLPFCFDVTPSFLLDSLQADCNPTL